jgi:hypothetical protein
MSIQGDNINLVFGRPISIGNGRFHIRQLTIDEILDDIGIDEYYKYVNALTLDKHSIQLMLQTLDKVEFYNFIMLNMIYDKEDKYSKLLCGALELFLCEKVYFNASQLYFYTSQDLVNIKKITQLDFDDIAIAIRNINCFEKEKIINISSEAELNYYIKAKEQKAKHSQEDESDLSNIISSVCARHHTYNYSNIGELTIYQLLEQFKRICKIDEYFININSLVHGADKKEIQLKHWSEKIND